MNKEFAGYNHTMLFGKHKGRLIGDIAETDPGYIVWLSDSNVLKIETHIVNMCREDSDDLGDLSHEYDAESWGDRD
jgi:hypothetical protein